MKKIFATVLISVFSTILIFFLFYISSKEIKKYNEQEDPIKKESSLNFSTDSLDREIDSLQNQLLQKNRFIDSLESLEKEETNELMNQLTQARDSINNFKKILLDYSNNIISLNLKIDSLQKLIPRKEDTSTVVVETTIKEKEEIPIDNIKVYPNPFSNSVNISNPGSVVIAKAIIKNVNGLIVKEIIFPETIPTNELRSGVYFIYLFSKDNKEIFRERIIKR